MVGLALVSPMSAVGNPTAGAIDFVYVPKSEFELNIPGTGSGDDDGDGFGVKGWAKVSDAVFVHGEYQSTETDEFSIEIDQVRAGVGGMAEISEAVTAYGVLEYTDFELSVPGAGSADDDGFAVHGGLLASVTPQFGLEASFGLIKLGDVDGNEIRLGARYRFSPEFSGFADYRATSLEEDDGTEFDISDFRLGVGFHF